VCAMGGTGSGNHYHWWRHGKKTVVEDCRELDANRWMREKLLVGGVWHSGGWVWCNAQTGEQISSIGYEVCTLDMSRPWVRLNYTFTASQENVNYRINLTTTSPQFGGLRWWFICPLVLDSRPCERRVGKLYLPPSARYYGCRHCYQLTYTSCQESRKCDSLYRFMARNTGEDLATLKRVLQRLRKHR